MTESNSQSKKTSKKSKKSLALINKIDYTVLSVRRKLI